MSAEPADTGEATVLAVVAVFVAAEAPPAASASTLARLIDSTEPRKAKEVLFIGASHLLREFDAPNIAPRPYGPALRFL